MALNRGGPDLRVRLGRLTLKNPVLVASGTAGFGEELSDFFDLSLLGAFVTKTVTLEPRPGFPPPRACETPSGMLNAIGLQNPGVDVFIRDHLPRLRARGVTVLVSVAGDSVQEMVRVAERIASEPGVAGVELNLSCPNVEDRARIFAMSPEATARAVAGVRRAVRIPLLAKLTAAAGDVVAVAEAAARAGAEALSITNTLPGMAIDVARRRPKLGATLGGLSGPAIRPIAVAAVWQVSRALPGVPIVGMGGVTSAEDALEFIMAGAWAVAVGTANFSNPRAPLEVLEGVRRFMEAEGVSSLEEIRGSLKPW